MIALKKNAVPLLALLVAVGAVAGVVRLESHANASRAAQVRLAEGIGALAELQGLPYHADPRDASALVVSSRMGVAEDRILGTIARVELKRPKEQADLIAPVALNFAALGRIYTWAAGGRVPAAAAGSLADAAQATFASAVANLRAHGREHTAAAKLAQRQAMAGSILLIVLLLGAFAFYYRLSAKTKRAQRRAYAELDAAKHDRERLLARMVEAAEHERMRFAADLHDGPIQRLTAAAFSLDMLGRKLARGEREVDALVLQIREQLSGEMVSLRRLMSELRPPLLDDGDVSAAIRDCAEELLGPETSCDVRDETGDARWAPDLETVVYRVAREAIVNVQKHAQATRVAVTLESVGDRLQLTVVDDGSGFDPSALDTARFEHHLGLVAMQERVESVGGEWRISSVRGSGTRVEALLPWRARPDVESRGTVSHAAVA